MVEVAVEVEEEGLHLSSTYQQTSSTQPPQLIQGVQGTTLAQETEGHPGWPLQPPGPPSAHLEPTTGPWALRYHWTDGWVHVCLGGWMDRQIRSWHQYHRLGNTSETRWINKTSLKQIIHLRIFIEAKLSCIKKSFRESDGIPEWGFFFFLTISLQ